MSRGRIALIMLGLIALGAAAGSGYWFATHREPARIDDLVARQMANEREAARQAAAQSPTGVPAPPVKNLRADIAKLAALLKRDDQAGVREYGRNIAAGASVKEIMCVFRHIAETDRDGKFALGNTENADIERIAYQVAAVAQVMGAKDPLITPPDTISYGALIDNFRSGAWSLVNAAKSNDGVRILEATRTVQEACKHCHRVVRDKEMPRPPQELSDKTDTKELLVLIRGESPRHRLDAIRLLAERRKEADVAAPALADALYDDVAGVRQAALAALVHLKRKESTGHEALDEALKTREPALRFLVAEHVRRAGSPIEGLIAALGSSADEARAEVAGLIPLVGADAARAEAKLRELQEKDPDADVRIAAARALAELRQENPQEELIRELKDADPVIRGRAALALAKLGKAAVPGLCGVLKDGSRDSRASAIGALMRIGPDAKEAAPDLLALTKGDDALLRKLAENAIQKIDPK
ncbi:hypothetical protein AYO40_04080 [Planctomycetaceae bacterium SCGC AG-212-D15]|nr:hypothetical protein AYO40_04080 [Planctomycetaceae bacterium SCGC AG-212-D15]